MRIFYHINLTEKSPASDIISFAFVDDKGSSIYAESVDHNKAKPSPESEELLGESGFKKIVAEVSKSACVQGNIDTIRDRLAQFLSRFDKTSITLIGHSNYWQMQALLWLLNWESVDNQVGIIHISNEIMYKHEDLPGEVLPFLPETNALRKAVTYKHIARKLERRFNK